MHRNVSLIEPYKSKIILGVSADWEYDSDNKCTSSLTKSSRTEIVKTFCDYINEKGYTAFAFIQIKIIIIINLI